MRLFFGRIFRVLAMAVCLSGLLFGCNLRDPLPIPIEDIDCRKVEIAPGPEDFVLDVWSGPPRLLVSSHDRRVPESSGGIYCFDIGTEATGEISRIGEPETLVAFKPHGMDIRKDGSQTLIYVILHDPYGRLKREENAIAVYRVEPEVLRFVELLEDAECLWSPNDLSVMPSGDIYVTNDVPGSLSMYLRSESSEIAFYDHREKAWKIVADGIAFANGILAEKDRVYVTATLGDAVMVYPRAADGSLGTPETLVRVKGPDNLMRYKDSLLTTAHYDDLAFLDHRKDPEKPAPSIVFRIRPELYTKDAVYVDSGRTISAASTAMIFRNKLYISQVFDPYIVICKVPVFLK